MKSSEKSSDDSSQVTSTKQHPFPAPPQSTPGSTREMIVKQSPPLPVRDKIPPSSVQLSRDGLSTNPGKFTKPSFRSVLAYSQGHSSLLKKLKSKACVVAVVATITAHIATTLIILTVNICLKIFMF